MTKLCTTIAVNWGHDVHAITLTKRNWTRVGSGRSLSIRGKGYVYEGKFFWDYWDFAGGIGGYLVVRYGGDGAVGFDGVLSDAMIQEHD
jgi:hypothetical protein